MLLLCVPSRGMASSSKPPPEERAAEIINTLPSSPGLVTKTGTAILGTGLLATAISQELYVVNEETVIAAGFFILISFIYKVCPVSFLLLGGSAPGGLFSACLPSTSL